VTLEILLALLAAQTPARVVLLPIQPVDEIPARVTQKLDELLAAEIESVPHSGGKPVGPSAAEKEAKLARDRGLESYRALQFAASIEQLRQATELLEGALDRIADFELLVAAHVDLAVAQLGAKQNEAAEASLARALQLRPELALSMDQYPPRVIQTFDKVRKKILAKKKVRVSVSSSPGFAKVEVDGLARGDTPLNLELLPGRHRWVVEKEGHLPVRGIVPLATKEESVEVTLAEDPIPRAKAIIAGAVKSGAPIDEGLAAAGELAAALGVEEVLVPALATEGDGYLLALARIAGGARTELLWARTDRDLSDANDAIRELAAGKSGPPSTRIDPARSLAGLGPMVAKEQPIAVETPVTEPESSNAVWWWVGIGGAVVIAAAAGTTAYFLTRPDDPGDRDNIFVVIPNPGSN
jgi:hypothetical protein